MAEFYDFLYLMLSAIVGAISVVISRFDFNKELEYRRNRKRRLLEEEQQRVCPHAYPPEESGANSVKSACEYIDKYIDGMFYQGFICKLCSKRMSDREMKLHKNKMNYWTENVRELRKKYKRAQNLKRKSERI